MSESGHKPKWWAVLNSNFMIFVFSSIVVAGISEYYKHWKEMQEEKSALLAQTLDEMSMKSKLKNEITARNRTLACLLDSIPLYKKIDCELAFFGNSVRKEVKANYYNFKPLYSEFENKSLFELLVEYRELLRKVQQPTDHLEDCIEILINYRDELVRVMRVFDLGNDGRIYPVTKKVKRNGEVYFTYGIGEKKTFIPEAGIPPIPFYSVKASSKYNLEKIIESLKDL